MSLKVINDRSFRTASNSAQLSGQTTASIGFWINYDPTSLPVGVNCTTVLRNDSASFYSVLNPNGVKCNLLLRWTAANGSAANYTKILTPGVWYHIVCTFDDGLQQAIINGVSNTMGTISGSTVKVIATPFVIGQVSSGRTSTFTLDDVFMLNGYAVSLAEAGQLRDRLITPGDLTGYSNRWWYKLNGTVSGTASASDDALKDFFGSGTDLSTAAGAGSAVYAAAASFSPTIEIISGRVNTSGQTFTVFFRSMLDGSDVDPTQILGPPSLKKNGVSIGLPSNQWPLGTSHGVLFTLPDGITITGSDTLSISTSVAWANSDAGVAGAVTDLSLTNRYQKPVAYEDNYVKTILPGWNFPHLATGQGSTYFVPRNLRYRLQNPLGATSSRDGKPLTWSATSYGSQIDDHTSANNRIDNTKYPGITGLIATGWTDDNITKVRITTSDSTTTTVTERTDLANDSAATGPKHVRVFSVVKNPSNTTAATRINFVIDRATGTTPNVDDVVIYHQSDFSYTDSVPVVLDNADPYATGAIFRQRIGDNIGIMRFLDGVWHYGGMTNQCDKEHIRLLTDWAFGENIQCGGSNTITFSQARPWDAATTPYVYTDFIGSTYQASLASNCDSSTTTISITNATSVPIMYGQRILIGSEQMRVTAQPTSNSVSVERAANGTTAASHTAGSNNVTVMYRVTLSVLADWVSSFSTANMVAAEFVSSANHGLKTGQAPTFSAGFPDFTYTNGGTKNYSGIQRCAFVTGPTTFVILESIGSGQGTLTSTVTLGTQTTTIKLPESAGLPFEYQFKVLSQYADCDAVVDVPYLAGNDLQYFLAGLALQSAPVGRRYYLEVGNEPWNGAAPFSNMRWLVSTMTKFLGGSYERYWYVKRSVEVWNIWRAVFATAGREAEICLGLNVQQGVTSDMSNYLDYCRSAGVAMNNVAIMVAPYVGQPFSTAAAAYCNVVNDEQWIDTWIHDVAYGTSTTSPFGMVPSYVGLINNFNSTWATNAELITYEGDINNAIPNAAGINNRVSRNRDIIYNPNWRFAAKTVYYMAQSTGFKRWLSYAFSMATDGASAGANEWGGYHHPLQLPGLGDGSDGQADNRLTLACPGKPNSKPATTNQDLANVSVRGQAFLEWGREVAAGTPPTSVYTTDWENGSAGWNLQSQVQLTVVGSGAYSPTHALRLVGGANGTRYFGTWGTQDGRTGNVSITGHVKLAYVNPVVGASADAGLTFRGSASSLNNTDTSFYMVRVLSVFNGVASLRLSRTVNGSMTNLATLNVPDGFDQASYFEITALVTGTSSAAIAITVKRISDGFYLASSGNWQLAAGTAMNFTDSTAPLTGSSYHGYVFNANSNFTLEADDFTINAATLTPSVSANTNLTAATTATKTTASVAVAAGLGLAAAATKQIDAVAAASATFNLAAVTARLRDAYAPVSTTFNLASVPDRTRDIARSIASNIGLSFSPTSVKDVLSNAAATINAVASSLAGRGSGVFAVSLFDRVNLADVAAQAATLGSIRVADQVRFTDIVSTTYSPRSVDVASVLNINDVATAQRLASLGASVLDGFRLSCSPVSVGQFGRTVEVTTGLNLSDRTAAALNTSYSVDASVSFRSSDVVSQASTLNTEVFAVESVRFYSYPSTSVNLTYAVLAIDRLTLGTQPIGHSDVAAFVESSLVLAGGTQVTQDGLRSAMASIGLSDLVSSGREISVGVTVGMGLSGPGAPSGQFHVVASSDSVGLAGVIVTHVGATVEPEDTLAMSAYVSAMVHLPSGVGIVPGDPSTGLSFPLVANLSASRALTFAPMPNGSVLMSNGVDPPVIWDSLSGTADYAGTPAPTDALSLSASGSGLITGRRLAFVRFLDVNGNPSSLSQPSNEVDCGHERPLDDIAIGGNGQATITVAGHELPTLSAVVIRDVGGISSINGAKTVTRVDGDTLVLDGVFGGDWQGGGSLVYGSDRVTYANVPVPTDQKVVRRQILRNLEGNMDVFYVDIDTTDLTSTTFESQRSDESLRLQEAVPWADDQGMLWAQRFDPPPNNKPVVASFMGRAWLAGDIAYDDGCVLPVTGSRILQGVDTQWPASFEGRSVYMAGARAPYVVDAVDVDNQRLLLDRPIAEALARFCPYEIRSDLPERRAVYYSEPGEYGVWPAWNAVTVPDDGDDVVGMVQYGQALVIFGRRHIYRLLTRGHPAEDANLFLMAYRGCLSQRLAVEADGYIYMFDESGLHAYDGSESCRPISGPIQTLWHADNLDPSYKIDWTADQRAWHGCLDPNKTTIRWFVDFVGKDHLTHAICFNYRSGSFWLESYPFSVTSSATGSLGHRRAIAGDSLRRVFVLGEGSTDAVNGSGTLRGTLTSVASDSLSDSAANFPSSLAGTPVAIIDGAGRGQTRIIAENTADTLTLVDPLEVVPSIGDTYQIGGVPWQWQSDWQEVAQSESESSTPA